MNDIVAASVVTGWAEMKGTVGKEMDIEPIDRRGNTLEGTDQKKPRRR